MNWMHFLNDMRALSPEDEGGAAGGDAPTADAPIEAEAPTEQPVDAGAQAPASTDFDWLPEQFRGENGPDLNGFRSHYADLAAEAGIRSEALAAVPESPDKYDLSLPEDLDFGDLDLPEGYVAQLNVEDEAFAPLFDELKTFMHENQMPKEAAPKLLGMLAKYEASQYSRAATDVREQIKALGPQGEARVSRVSRAIETKLSEGQASALKGALRTAEGVRALETLLAPRSLGASSASNPPAPKNDLEAYYSTPTR